MTLVIRCSEHPAYNGSRKPGDTALQKGWGSDTDPARGSQTCRDCWELYRRAHEGVPAHVLEGFEGGS